MKTLILLFAILASTSLKAQPLEKPEETKTSIGLEADVLPYLTGGYYGSVWVAHSHVRYRAVITNVTTPDFMLEDGFTNNEMTVYALLIDYFFKSSVEKWWVGGGLEYWDAEIQTNARLSTATYECYVATVGGGYVWKLHKNFYLNPWVAMHARLGGDSSAIVDGKEFAAARFTPEASLKLGWYFQAREH